MSCDGPTALNRALSGNPDLVVLDIMMPGMDGLEVCRRMRRSITTPVILLTALGAESDRVAGLEIGADDYVTKPFSPRELTLRVQAVLRRARGSAGTRQVGVLRDGDLTLDLGARQAVLAGEDVLLTTREFDLLAFFLTNPGQVFSRKELLATVWGWTVGDESTVTVHVRRLRGKARGRRARSRSGCSPSGDRVTGTSPQTRHDPGLRLGGHRWADRRLRGRRADRWAVADAAAAQPLGAGPPAGRQLRRGGHGHRRRAGDHQGDVPVRA